MKKESCPECRREMKIDKILNETEAIMECQHCKKTFKFTYDEKTFPSNINSFNWGAFFIGGLWAVESLKTVVSDGSHASFIC